MRIEELEDYKPIINERLANNELAIYNLIECYDDTIGSPAVNKERFEQRLE